MSKTDNTRPWDVMMADPTTPKAYSADRTGIQTADPVYCGGMRSHRGHAKQYRSEMNAKLRQTERAALHKAKQNPEDADVPPRRGTKRGIGRFDIN